MESPFDSILLARSERAVFLKQLFSETITSGLFIAVIVKRGWKRIPLLAITKNRKYLLTRAVDANTLAEVAETIANRVRWHMNGFCILFGEERIISDLVQCPELLGQSVPEIKCKVNHTINGYMFPLDDELLFYGDEKLEQVVNQAKGQR